MGLNDTLKASMDTKREYQLANEMTIEEVFALIEKAGLDPAVVGSFKLKKGLFGKSITFKGDTAAQGILKVKGNKAVLTKLLAGGKKVGSGFSVGGVPIGANPKGVMTQADAENAYFAAVGDALKGILK